MMNGTLVSDTYTSSHRQAGGSGLVAPSLGGARLQPSGSRQARHRTPVSIISPLDGPASQLLSRSALLILFSTAVNRERAETPNLSFILEAR